MLSGRPGPWPKTAMRHRRSSDSRCGSSPAMSRRTPFQDRRARSGAIRPTEITPGPLIGRLVRVVPVFTASGRAARSFALTAGVSPGREPVPASASLSRCSPTIPRRWRRAPYVPSRARSTEDSRTQCAASSSSSATTPWYSCTSRAATPEWLDEYRGAPSRSRNAASLRCSCCAEDGVAGYSTSAFRRTLRSLTGFGAVGNNVAYDVLTNS